MSPRSWQDRVEDILSCARNIRDYTEGMSFDAFLDDSKTIRAVAFEFTTMGEAARVIPLDIQKKFPEVPWGRCREFATCSYTSISAWTKRSFRKPVRRIFHP